MTRDRQLFLALQLVLGPLVLASYAYGATHWPSAVSAMWGGVPQGARGVYTAWMFVAAAGYLTFTPILFLRSPTLRTRIAYAAVLVGSVLWLPLTKWHLDGLVPFGGVVLDLAVVAVGSLALLAIALRAPLSRAARVAAVVGAAAFCLQTVLLDAVVWPALWRS
jgi:hypothetical protein